MEQQLKKYFTKHEIEQHGLFYKLNALTNYQPDFANKKLILITSINPTPAGEGKTTTLIGLNDCLNYFGIKSLAVLRQPSMGPFYGLKGGATGYGECQVLYSDQVNSGLTADFFYIEQANNLIISILENEIFFKSKLAIDPNSIFWNRCIDINDRNLRDITYSLGTNLKYQTSFVITAASYLMALFCLAKNSHDFFQKLNQTIIAFSQQNTPISIKDLKINNGLKLVLQTALKPNVVFSKHLNPILMHGGPFANIAHGTNSLIATYYALAKSDYVFCEAGFGSDLGAEKFFNIKCRHSNIIPSLVVLVISLKAVKHHADQTINDWKHLIDSGFAHITYHYRLIKQFGANVVIIINRFKEDLTKELAYLHALCANLAPSEISTMAHEGPSKAKNLWQLIVQNAKKTPSINYTYQLKESAWDKITKICQTIYGAQKVDCNKAVKTKLQKYAQYIQNFYVCNAKTPFSISTQSDLLGVPKNHNVMIEDVKFNFCANFIIPILSKTFLMPGLGPTTNIQSKTFT